MSEIILFTCDDSPPGRAVQMALTYLNVPYKIQTVNFDVGEHFSKEFLTVIIPTKLLKQWNVNLLFSDVSTR